MTKKFKSRILISLFVAILLVTYYFNRLDAFTLHVYNFETKNGDFKGFVMPSKGRDLEYMKNEFVRYKERNPYTADTILYRTFKLNYLKFWRWHDYATEDLYQYEFKK